MKKLTIISGNHYGKLTTIKEAGKNSLGRYLWKCNCSCGNVITTTASALHLGSAKSCGCTRNIANKKRNGRRRTLPKGGAAFNDTYRMYKRHAKEKSLPSTLTPEKFREMTQKDCFYCGSPPQNGSGRRNVTGSYRYNGIDRVDNQKGYIEGNMVPCCRRCNKMKETLTQEEFRNHLLSILDHWVV